MRYFTFFLLLFVVGLLQAEDIDLGNVYITSETEQIDDNLKFKQDLSEFWRLKTLEKFEYYPAFSKEEIAPPGSGINNRNLAVKLDTGTNTPFDLNAVFKKNDLLTFSSDITYEKFKTEGNYIFEQIADYGNFRWNPTWKKNKLLTELYMNDNLNDTWWLGYSVDYESDYEIKMFESIILRNTNFKFDSSVLVQSDTDLKDTDFKFSTDWYADVVKGNVQFNHLIGSASFDATTFYTGLGFIDEAGIWLAADERTIYASVAVRKDVSVLEKVHLSVSNDPEISSSSRRELLSENYFQNIQMSSLQSKAPLNAYIKTEINGQVPVTLVYNIKGLLDQRNYTALGTEIIDGMYWQKVGLCAFYEYQDFEFQQNLFYHKTCKTIAFAPEFESKSEIKYSYDKLTTSLEFNFLTGRKDFTNEYLTDAYLLNLFADYRLFDNLHVNLSIDNILNQDFYTYHDVYKDDFRLKLGCIWELF